MSDFNKIEREIARLDTASDDQSICGVDAGRTGPCHAGWTMEEAANSMRLLLDVARAADEYYEADGSITNERLYDALTALQEHLDE